MDGLVVVVQAEGRAGRPNAERRKHAILGRGTKWPRDFQSRAAVQKAVGLIMLRTSRAEQVRVVCVSNVIYQKWYLIRLIYISVFLSIWIPVIYQIAR